MESYFIDINKLIVKDQNVRYDFLSEMYPVINELYSRLWFYENLAILKPETKEKKINELKEYISTLLDAYNIPESLLLVHVLDNKYMEPITGTHFRLAENVEVEEVSTVKKDIYVDLFKTSSFFKHDIPKFKEIIKTKYKKR